LEELNSNHFYGANALTLATKVQSYRDTHSPLIRCKINQLLDPFVWNATPNSKTGSFILADQKYLFSRGTH